ncbi:MAG: phage integrase SAM-like domain-containing protein, partial [Flavobacteriia bacterium]
MKTVKPILWPRATSEGDFQIKIRITDNRKSSYIDTKIKVKKGDWNPKKNRVKLSHPNAEHFNELIDLYLSKYLSGVEVLKKNNDKTLGTLGLLLEMRIQDFHSQSRMAAVRRYNTLLNHLKVIKLDKMPLGELNMIHRQRLDQYFISEAKIEASTRHTYHKVIRTSLKYAEGLPQFFKMPDHNIYYNHKVTYKSRTKVSLKSSEILSLYDFLNYKEFNLERHATQLFLFSFATMGMRFKDVLMLKWENILEGHIDYVMSKNLRSMRVKLNENIVNVLKFYLPNEYYLNPFLSPDVEPKFKNKVSERIYELEQAFYSLKTFQIASLIYYSESEEKPVSNEPEQVVNILKERDKLLEELISLYAKGNKGYIFTKIYEDVSEYNVT